MLKEQDKIIKGFELVYERLIKHKRQLNRPLIISIDKKIIEANPHKMPSTLEAYNKLLQSSPQKIFDTISAFPSVD